MKLDFKIEGVPVEAEDYRSFRAILEARAVLTAMPDPAHQPARERSACSFTRAGLDRLFAAEQQGKGVLNPSASSFGEPADLQESLQPGDPADGPGKSAPDSHA